MTANRHPKVWHLYGAQMSTDVTDAVVAVAPDAVPADHTVEAVGVWHKLVGPVRRPPTREDAVDVLTGPGFTAGDEPVHLDLLGSYGHEPSEAEISDAIARRFPVACDRFGDARPPLWAASWGEPTDEERRVAGEDDSAAG